MIGQEKLLSRIDNLIAEDKLPRFSIIVGERGMEHEDVARYIAYQYQGADYIQLPDVKIDTIRKMIKQAYSLHNLTFFCIPHADDMSVNAKNAILKVTEEAPNKAHIIMCLEDLNNTLATIQSRATVFCMDRCKRDDIENFALELCVSKSDKDSDIDEERIKLIGKFCSTPGDVLYFTEHDIKDFQKFVDTVKNEVLTVDGAEAFKFANKLALKDDEDKWDLRLFMRALQISFWDDSNKPDCYYDIVMCIGKYSQDLRIKGINRQMLIDSMVLEMRKVWKSQK